MLLVEKMELKIEIERIKNDDNYNRALLLHQELKTHNIFFETSITESFWYWDLSTIIGATDQTILHILFNENIKHNVIKIKDIIMEGEE